MQKYSNQRGYRRADHDRRRQRKPAQCRMLIEQSGVGSICCEARNGREAIAVAQECRPDLAIIDLAMPELDGLAASKQISALLPRTPIITAK